MNTVFIKMLQSLENIGCEHPMRKTDVQEMYCGRILSYKATNVIQTLLPTNFDFSFATFVSIKASNLAIRGPQRSHLKSHLYRGLSVFVDQALG